jgi:primosomal protein N'
MEQQETNKPVLIEIANGWAAHGDGWAVHGHTREEAIENYWKAEQRHREILALPPWYQQVEIQSMHGSQYA